MLNVRDFKIDFIGIGVIRSASTWIYSCLKEHPEVCVSLKKEILFFNNENNYSKGIHYYKSFFSHCTKNKIIGEFSPQYISSSKASQRIYKLFPNVKLIVCLRNPIERAYSEYRYWIQLGLRHITYDTFEKAIKNDISIIKKGFYYSQLKPYFELFPRENILILIYEDIEANPTQFMRKLYTFLGLEKKDFIPSLIKEKINVSGDFSYKSRIPLILQTIYRLFNFLGQYKFLKKLPFTVEVADKIIQEISKSNLIMISQEEINRKKLIAHLKDKKVVVQKESDRIKPIPPISHKMCIQLNKIFRNEIKELEDLLKINLDIWKNF